MPWLYHSRSVPLSGAMSPIRAWPWSGYAFFFRVKEAQIQVNADCWLGVSWTVFKFMSCLVKSGVKLRKGWMAAVLRSLCCDTSVLKKERTSGEGTGSWKQESRFVHLPEGLVGSWEFIGRKRGDSLLNRWWEREFLGFFFMLRLTVPLQE